MKSEYGVDIFFVSYLKIERLGIVTIFLQLTFFTSISIRSFCKIMTVELLLQRQMREEFSFSAWKNLWVCLVSYNYDKSHLTYSISRIFWKLAKLDFLRLEIHAHLNPTLGFFKPYLGNIMEREENEKRCDCCVEIAIKYLHILLRVIFSQCNHKFMHYMRWMYFDQVKTFFSGWW